MARNEQIHDLFDRYAAAVGSYLPLGGREDIEREIAATLADKLDDRSSAKGGEPTMEDALALLEETGHPRKTAAAYLTHGYVVGPSVYPLFQLVARVALPVLAAVLIGAMTLSAGLDPEPGVSVFEYVLRILGSTLTGVLQAFAVIVIVFALIERADPSRRAAQALDPGESWDPRELPKRLPVGTIRTGDRIASVVFGTIFIVFLVFLPRLVGLGVTSRGEPVATLALSEGFRRLLPLLYVSTGVEILASLFLLTRRAHTVPTIAASIAARALAIVASGMLLAAWPFVLVGSGAPGGVRTGIDALNQVIRVGCILGIIGGCIELGRELFRFLRARKAA